MGDKIGRIHLGRQDLSELQTRKMKGLKRARDAEEQEQEAEDEDVISEDGNAVGSGVETKKARLE